MSDPQPLPGRKKPTRAEPLQPDQPGRGDQTNSDADDMSPHSGAAAASPTTATPDEPGGSTKQKKQSSDALGNVREGYD